MVWLERGPWGRWHHESPQRATPTLATPLPSKVSATIRNFLD